VVNMFGMFNVLRALKMFIALTGMHELESGVLGVLTGVFCALDGATEVSKHLQVVVF